MEKDNVIGNLANLARYVRKWGLRGILVWFKVKVFRGDQKVYVEKLKSYIKVRGIKSDVKVFEDVFLFENMKMPFKIQPKVIVDAGAYNGFTSAYFSSEYENATIYSIEPSRENYEVLKENTDSFRNIKPIRGALWIDSSGVSIQQNNPKGSPWSFETKDVSKKNDKKVRSFSVSDIIESKGIEGIDILKMDIEGAEKRVFEDCRDWISKVGVISIEFHDRKVEGCSRQFYDAISEREFRRYTGGENVFIKFK